MVAFFKVAQDTAGNQPINSQMQEIIEDYLAAGFSESPKCIILDNIRW